MKMIVRKNNLVDSMGVKNKEAKIAVFTKMPMH